MGSSRFLRQDAQYSKQDFVDACVADADTDLQDPSALFGYSLHTYSVYYLFIAVTAFLLRVEHMSPSEDASDLEACRGVRLCWASVALAFFVASFVVLVPNFKEA